MYHWIMTLLSKFDHPAIVTKKTILDDKHFIITFRPDEKINFLPGQYLSVVLDGKRPAPFSIASSTAQYDIELGIGVHGEVTTALRDTPVGTRVILRGPFGRFTLQDQKKVCFLSGGVGLTPFVSMLRSLRDAHSDVDAILLASSKRKTQFLWPDELLTMRVPQRVVFTLTEEQNSAFPHGRIDAAFVRKYVPDFEQRTFYACGPDAFITAMFSVLKELGIDEARMVKEAW